MKTYYISIATNDSGIYIKADWFSWIDDLYFYKGFIGDEENSEIIAVFRKWDYFYQTES